MFLWGKDWNKMQIWAQGSTYVPEWNCLQPDKMHVHASEHGWENWAFFRKKFRVPKYGTLATDDESLHEPLEYDEHESITTANHEPFPTANHEPIPTTGHGKGGPKLKENKTRRGWGSKRKKQIKLSIFGNNANGLKAKSESLINSLKFFGGPSCVLIQETKLRFSGTFRLAGYQIFKKTRSAHCNWRKFIASSNI